MMKTDQNAGCSAENVKGKIEPGKKKRFGETKYEMVSWQSGKA